MNKCISQNIGLFILIAGQKKVILIFWWNCSLIYIFHHLVKTWIDLGTSWQTQLQIMQLHLHQSHMYMCQLHACGSVFGSLQAVPYDKFNIRLHVSQPIHSMGGSWQWECADMCVCLLEEGGGGSSSFECASVRVREEQLGNAVFSAYTQSPL